MTYVRLFYWRVEFSVKNIFEEKNSFTRRHRMNKRPRVVVEEGKTYNYDKRIVSVAHTNVGSTKVDTTLDTSEKAQFIVGLRWNISISQSAGTGTTTGIWAIVTAKGSYPTNSFNTNDGATTYSPESQLLTFGTWSITASNVSYNYDNHIKTGRKVQEGDTLHFIAIGVVTQTVNIQGSVQWFYKD